MKIDNYHELIRELKVKEAERKKYCCLVKIPPASLVKRDNLPREIKYGKMLYLGYGRNAWHSTWIRRYYPGSISLFEKDLQSLCENLRVQGSVFRIETVPVVYLVYKEDVVVLVAINDRSSSAYRPLITNISPYSLAAFWSSAEFEIDNWLIPFILPAWRPDLHPKRFHRMSSSPQGAGKPLSWSRREVDEGASGICTAFSDFMPSLLTLSRDSRMCSHPPAAEARQGKTRVLDQPSLW
jgi:hypothetical protein